MSTIDQIAAEAARQISFNWARTTQQDIEDIIKSAIEKSEQLRAQLAAAEAQDLRHMEKAHREVMLERRQLASEREKVQTLVDALERIAGYGCFDTCEQPANIAEAALAKVNK